MAELVVEAKTRSERETQALGSAFGRLLRPGDVAALQGDLGAGKTVFVRGVVTGLGADPAAVQSPTFTIVQTYAGAPFPVHHLDLYRLSDPENELSEIGGDAFLDPREGVSLIEWGEKAAGLLPGSRFDVAIRPSGSGDPSERVIAIFARGEAQERAAEIAEAISGVAGGAVRAAEAARRGESEGGP